MLEGLSRVTYIYLRAHKCGRAAMGGGGKSPSQAIAKKAGVAWSKAEGSQPVWTSTGSVVPGKVLVCLVPAGAGLSHHWEFWIGI